MMTENVTPDSESEFGKGLTYCLGLFLAHAERVKEMRQVYAKISTEDQNIWAEMWFNGAADHLFDLVIPDQLSPNLKDRLSTFQSKCLHWRMALENRATGDDVTWAIQEAKNLLRLIDQQYGIEVIQGQWE